MPELTQEYMDEIHRWVWFSKDRTPWPEFLGEVQFRMRGILKLLNTRKWEIKEFQDDIDPFLELASIMDQLLKEPQNDN